MKRIKVGFVAKRTEDGGFVHDRDLYRDVPDSEVGDNGLTKCEERCLKTAAVNVFAELVKENPEFRKRFGFDSEVM